MSKEEITDRSAMIYDRLRLIEGSAAWVEDIIAAATPPETVPEQVFGDMRTGFVVVPPSLKVSPLAKAVSDLRRGAGDAAEQWGSDAESKQGSRDLIKSLCERTLPLASDLLRKEVEGPNGKKGGVFYHYLSDIRDTLLLWDESIKLVARETGNSVSGEMASERGAFRRSAEFSLSRAKGFAIKTAAQLAGSWVGPLGEFAKPLMEWAQDEERGMTGSERMIKKIRKGGKKQETLGEQLRENAGEVVSAGARGLAGSLIGQTKESQEKQESEIRARRKRGRREPVDSQAEPSVFGGFTGTGGRGGSLPAPSSGSLFEFFNGDGPGGGAKKAWWTVELLNRLGGKAGKGSGGSEDSGEDRESGGSGGGGLWGTAKKWLTDKAVKRYGPKLVRGALQTGAQVLPAVGSWLTGGLGMSGLMGSGAGSALGGSLGAGAALTSGALVVGAGAAGYGAGKLIRMIPAGGGMNVGDAIDEKIISLTGEASAQRRDKEKRVKDRESRRESVKKALAEGKGSPDFRASMQKEYGIDDAELAEARKSVGGPGGTAPAAAATPGVRADTAPIRYSPAPVPSVPPPAVDAAVAELGKKQLDALARQTEVLAEVRDAQQAPSKQRPSIYGSKDPLMPVLSSGKYNFGVGMPA